MKKLTKCSVVLGRFQPFHAGHLSLIKKALLLNNMCVIIIGSADAEISEKNPLTALQRERIIRNALETENINLQQIDFLWLENRKPPRDDFGFGDRIVDRLAERGYAPSHIVLGEEAKVDLWFRPDYPAKIVKVDRQNIDIDGTRIRKDVFENFRNRVVDRDVSRMIFNSLAYLSMKRFLNKDIKDPELYINKCIEYGKDIYNKLSKWLKDNYSDVGAFTVGISGGKDSSLAAAVLAMTFGPDKIIGIMMPDGEQHDIDKARKVCDILNIKNRLVVNIKSVTSAMRNAIKDAIKNASPEVQEYFGVNDAETFNDVYETNTPARIRMAANYGVAALKCKLNPRVTNTCNRSEDRVGYSTKFGDSAGDFSLFANLTVTQLMCLGLYLIMCGYLTLDLVFKTPEDGMSGKSDEEKLGFTYPQLDQFIMNGVLPPDETLGKITRMTIRNKHKIEPMPSFIYVPDEEIADWIRSR